MKTGIGKYCLAFLNLLSVSFGQTNSTDYFKTATKGDWNTVGTWLSSADGVNFSTATLSPNSTAAGIVITNGDTVVIGGAGVSFKNTTVKSGGTLLISTTTSYAIDGAGNQLLIESGGTLILNFSTVMNPTGSGTALIKSGGRVVVTGAADGPSANSIGDFYLNVNSKFSYEDNAVFEWDNSKFIFNRTGSNQYFKRVLTTDRPILKISQAPNSNWGTSSDNVFNCLLEVNTTLNIGGSGKKTFSGGLTGMGTIFHNAGKIILPDSSSVLAGNLNINTISSGLEFTKGAIVPLGANIKINVSATPPSTAKNISKPTGNLQIKGALDVTDCTIQNIASGAVTIENGGILKTSNASGFSGSNATIVSGNINLLSNSTIEFNSNGDQQFESRDDFKNLIFSSGGIKKPSSGFTPIGTVTIKDSAVFDCTGKNIGDGTTTTALTMTGGRLIVSTGGTQPMMGGPYNITGGVVEFADTSAKSIRAVTYQNIEVTGTKVGNSTGNITLGPQGKFTVKPGATFSINDNSITGPIGIQTVKLDSGAVFNCGNNMGFNGFAATFLNNSSLHANIENILLDKGATIAYTRNGNQLITNAGGLMYQNLKVEGNSGIKTAPTGTLIIKGDFIKNGTSSFDANRGTVEFNNESTAQKYTCTSFSPVNFYRLSNNNKLGLTIVNKIGIIDAINLQEASSLNLAAQDVTLLSCDSATGRLVSVPSTAVINYPGTGRFVVERFFPNQNPMTKRAWRLVTTPLLETATIFDQWQLGGASYSPANKHTGTLITGPQLAGNGLDFTPTNNYSLKQYNGSQFIGVANTKIPLSTEIGKGYFLFVRGDRNPVLTNPANNDFTTISARGKLQTGTVTIKVPYDFTLVGNPYASPIDFASLDKSNINPHRFYVWDPQLNAVGAYVVMEDYATSGTFLPTAPFGVSSQNNFIQSGQAFFVERNGLNPSSITFKEAAKASNFNPKIFRWSSSNAGEQDYVRAKLFLSADNYRSILADGNQVIFADDYINAVDQLDALKFGNINESFGLMRQGQLLAVERRSSITVADTLFYHISRTTNRGYGIQLEMNFSEKNIVGFWQDKYLKTSTPINASGSTMLHFDVNADTSSSATNRFQLVLVKKMAPPKFSFTNLHCAQNGNAILIQWKANNEWPGQQYIIERSANGTTFEKIGTISAKDAVRSGAYEWQDSFCVHQNHYRIKTILQDSAVDYSEVICLTMDRHTGTPLIFPNPITQDWMHITCANAAKGDYYVYIFDALGKKVLSQKYIHFGGTLNLVIKANSSQMVNGEYLLQYIYPNKRKTLTKIWINRRR